MSADSFENGEFENNNVAGVSSSFWGGRHLSHRLLDQFLRSHLCSRKWTLRFPNSIPGWNEWQEHPQVQNSS